MSRRRTSREPGLPAAAALAGGITGAHRSLLCETCGAELAHRASDGSQRCESHLAERSYDHPCLLTLDEARAAEGAAET